MCWYEKIRKNSSGLPLRLVTQKSYWSKCWQLSDKYFLLHAFLHNYLHLHSISQDMDRWYSVGMPPTELLFWNHNQNSQFINKEQMCLHASARSWWCSQQPPAPAVCHTRLHGATLAPAGDHQRFALGPRTPRAWDPNRRSLIYLYYKGATEL
jgi:hypothetical protein